MSNQIAAGKKRINVVLREEQIKRLDARAVELGTTRAALVSQAVDALLDGAPERDRAEAKLDAIAAKLDAMDAAQRLAAAGVLEAVRSQPIAVQQLAAPAPAEPDEASVLAWLSEHRPDAVATDAFGCPCIAPPAKVPQGRLARLRAAWRG